MPRDVAARNRTAVEGDGAPSPQLASRARARPVPAVAAGVSTGAVTHIDIVVNYGVDANLCVARIDKNGRVA